MLSLRARTLSWRSKIMNSGNHRIISAIAVLVAAGIPALRANPPVGAAPRLVNFSARGTAGAGADKLIAGFAIRFDSSSTQKNILVRGMGPSLGIFGVPGILEDPVLTFNVISGANPQYQATNAGWANSPVVMAPVDNIMLPGWGSVAFQSATAGLMSEVGAFAPISVSTKDSALVAILPAGVFTVGISGASGDSGTALAEIYDADAAMGSPANTARLVNLSARASVGTGSAVLIAGFVISGPWTETLLVRAMGPSLAPMGVTGALSATVLTVYDASGLAIATNAGWSNASVLGKSPVNVTIMQATSAIFTLAGAFQPVSSSSADSAMIVELPAGAYTLEVAGAGNATGIALAEIYEIPTQYVGVPDGGPADRSEASVRAGRP
jgi:hypothetical protein